MKNVVFSGPTAFTPVIRQLISYGIHRQRDLTMLIILTDEPKFSHEDKSFVDSIITLSKLSNTYLVIIGLGDGPWQRMSYEEHRIRELVICQKKNIDKTSTTTTTTTTNETIYDNFHFVHHSSTSMLEPNRIDERLARAVLKKLPWQLKQAAVHDQNDAHF
jgi:hypothetical protein